MVRFNVVFWILVCVVVMGCVGERGAVKYLNNHSAISSAYCADKYPVRDSVAPPVTVYAPANNIDHTREIDSLNRLANEARLYADSVSSAVDTTECGKHYSGVIKSLTGKVADQAKMINKLRDSYVKCKPDTAYVTNTVYRENTARVKSLRLKVDELNKINATNIKWKNIFMWSALVFMGLSAFLLFFKR